LVGFPFTGWFHRVVREILIDLSIHHAPRQFFWAKLAVQRHGGVDEMIVFFSHENCPSFWLRTVFQSAKVITRPSSQREHTPGLPKVPKAWNLWRLQLWAAFKSSGKNLPDADTLAEFNRASL
jgi:hypothetical protein